MAPKTKGTERQKTLILPVIPEVPEGPCLRRCLLMACIRPSADHGP